MFVSLVLSYRERFLLSRKGSPDDCDPDRTPRRFRRPPDSHSPSRSLLDTEGAIQQALNEAGVLATTESLKQFDTDGSPLEMGGTRYTSKGLEPKTYQTPYGETVVYRHVYQTSAGGATFCPLECDARIILTSTPRFAMQISHKYAEMPGARVVGDLFTNHHREVSLCLVQDLALAVGSVALAREEQWQYTLPPLEKPVATIGVGLDGTCMLITNEGPRQAMVGTISLYDAEGERLHTLYTAATPEYGKDTFYERLGREIDRTSISSPRRIAPELPMPLPTTGPS